jgi:hypothetical protein
MIMNYQEAKERVTHWDYVALKREGAPCHPDWYGIGCNPASDRGSERYNKQLNAYIKNIYGVSPDE